MGKTIPQRLQALRTLMKERGIAMYLVPTDDYHGSEYVGEYFRGREFMSGFTGSAGNLLVTADDAGLWTDARYFLQAEDQLQDSGITLFKMREEGVPRISEYVEQHLQEGETVGFDGRTLSYMEGHRLEEIVTAKHGQLHVDEDLVDAVWTDRPELSAEPAWIVDLRYAGESTADKLARVRKEMADKHADVHLLTSLTDIMWLLNVRGHDVESVPVVLSYLALTAESCIWFVQEASLTDGVRAYLAENGIEIREYDTFYDYIEQLVSPLSVWLDSRRVNYRVYTSVPEDVTIIDQANPTELMKAIKNKTEVANARSAHLKDAVAMCKFMYWLKTNVGKIPMTEISASDYLESLRAQQEGFLEISFATICGYAAHGAIVHYEATPETDVPIRPEGFLLVDSGGHYVDGTTDITRTFALGSLTQEMKEHFTRVCRANINLASTQFLAGCTGRNLDVIAREPLWEVGLDFKHGTGHGVGNVLSVHENPNAFRWQTSETVDECELQEGMITSDEPGVYLTDQYGIRTESEVLVRKGEKNEYGQFLYFENLTYAPIDLDALLPEQMSPVERERLNAYHARVYEVVAPYLDEAERAFLKKYTRAV